MGRKRPSTTTRKAIQVANLTPEKQAAIDKLLAEARELYQAIGRAEVPSSLAFAIRDQVPMEKLTDENLEALCKVVGECRKMPFWGKAPAPAAAPPAETEPAPAAVVPDKVLAPGEQPGAEAGA